MQGRKLEVANASESLIFCSEINGITFYNITSDIQLIILLFAIQLTLKELGDVAVSQSVFFSFLPS
jgi:hypothetical protein